MMEDYSVSLPYDNQSLSGHLSFDRQVCWSFAGSSVLSGDFHVTAGTSTYDANGALITDTGRGISSVTWDEINLPKTVTFTNGSTINYYYAADGTKLREVRTESGTATPAKRHFVRDHLGSIRAVVDDAGTTLETDDYYPLGGPLPTGTATALQPEKYQGKEWNATESFNIYDFGARLYDPGLGRWLSQDPMAEKYYFHSPYLFCAGNPMKFVDPEGRTIFFRVFHDNNTFTEYEWREMDGEWGFYDSDNEIYAGSNEYFLSLSILR